MTDRTRDAGSAEDFERDWADALASGDERWLIYPKARADEQTALLEWVKAVQVLALLRERGIRGGRVLEYGCGSAGMSVFLKEQGYQAYATDLSVRALQVAQINDRRHRTVATPLPVVAADSTRLPMADGTFDAVMSYGLLEHFETDALKRLLDDTIRVLRPGGLFVADIVPARPNARAVGTAVNFAASTLFHAARGQIGVVRDLPRRYFGHYYETSFGPAEWERILRDRGLGSVRVQVCRPFPPLAVRGGLETAYVRLMRAALPLWRRFDASDGWLSRRWGWMYLASGLRQ